MADVTLPSEIHEIKTIVKNWERQFTAEQGRKPTSTDAKADRNVWIMYQKYRAHKKQALGTNNESKMPCSPSKSHQKTKPVPQSPSKRGMVPPSPSKLSRTPVKPPRNAKGHHDSDTEDDEQTPRKEHVTEVFPTPQLRGRPLGLFDLDLPATPRAMKASALHSPLKNSHASIMRTPKIAARAETPQSKRTPDYFLHRANLFAPKTEDSPLIKPRWARKSVSEFVKQSTAKIPPTEPDPIFEYGNQEDASELDLDLDLSELTNDQSEMLDDTLTSLASTLNGSDLEEEPEPRLELDAELSDSHDMLKLGDLSDLAYTEELSSVGHVSGTAHETDTDSRGSNETTDTNETNTDVPIDVPQEAREPHDASSQAPNEPAETTLIELDANKEYVYDNVIDDLALSVPNFDRRRRPKRQTKRVIMRPVGVEKTVSNAKATDNFVRLKINKKNPFKRR